MRPPLKSTISLLRATAWTLLDVDEVIVRTTKAFVQQSAKACYLSSRNVRTVQWRSAIGGVPLLTKCVGDPVKSPLAMLVQGTA